MRELAPELLPEGLRSVVCVGVAGIPPLWKSSGRSASADAKLSSNRVVPRKQALSSLINEGAFYMMRYQHIFEN